MRTRYAFSNSRYIYTLVRFSRHAMVQSVVVMLVPVLLCVTLMRGTLSHTANEDIAPVPKPFLVSAVSAGWQIATRIWPDSGSGKQLGTAEKDISFPPFCF